MRQFKTLSIIVLLLCSYSTNAQYSTMADFTTCPSGSYPDSDLISDGAYLYGMLSEDGAYARGTIFKIQISNNTFTTIYNFDGSNGANPNGALISDGTYLYGMTKYGGINDKGTIFKIQISNNAFTKMFDFGDSNSGSYPHGSLISDGSYLYGMTNSGGSDNIGTIFKILISDNTYTTIYNFDGTNGRNPTPSLISDGTYLYGMTSSGGGHLAGCIFKIQIGNNAFTKMYDFDYGVNGCFPKGSLISDGNYLYGMTNAGGANSNGTIFKIQISNNAFTKMYDFDSNGWIPFGSLFSDGNYLYGMTKYGGLNNKGTVFKIQISNNAFTKMYDFDGTSGGYPLGSLISNGAYLFGMASEGGSSNKGTIFKIQISNNAFTKMYDFEVLTSAGKNPEGSLISDGNYLYGMTHDGGANGKGIIFKIQTSNNTFTKIFDFDDTSGGCPLGSLMSDGTYLYGMTTEGGTSNYGTIFKIQISNNAFTKMYDFSFLSYPRGSLISDGNYLYGLTVYGGSYGDGAAFKIQISNNTFTKMHNFLGTNSGAFPRGSLISDGNYLYGMTWSGGANSSGTIFKIQISNNTFTKMYDFDGTTGGRPYGSLISDGTYLYGTAKYGGTNDYGTIFKIQISDNSFTKMFDFDATNGGPVGSLMSDGTYLYGTANNIDANYWGSIFKIQISNNAFTNLYDFDDGGIFPIGSLISDGDYLYGVTSGGGTYSSGTVYKYNYKPSIQANNLTFTGLSGTNVTINWTNGSASKRAVFVKEGTGAISNLANAFTYTASNDWNFPGTQIGTSGYYCVYNGSENSVSLINLSPNNQYTVQVFEYNGTAGNEQYNMATTTNNPNTFTSLYSSPGTQSSELAFSTITTSQATINWLNGNGSSRAVFVKQGTGAITNPSNLITYAASSAWNTPGSQLGSSGYYCVYNGTGNSVSLSDLSENTQYTVQVFEYNGTAGNEQYNTTTAANNPNSFTSLYASPNAQSSELAFSTNTSSQATINWSNGNGSGRAVFVKQGTGAITNPSNLTSYAASSAWNTPGSQLGSSGYYCVYNGTGNSVSLSDLSAGTQYSVQVFEYNGTAGNEQYNTTTAANNPNSFTSLYASPGTQSSELAFSTISTSQATINWSNGNGSSRAVFVKQGTGAITNPSNLITYAASSAWNTPGSQLGSSGYYCVYNGTGNSVSLSDLSDNTQYTVQVFEYNGTAGNEQYNTSVSTDNPKSFTTSNTTGFEQIDANAINIYSSGKIVYIVNKNPESAELTVLDVSGKTLYSQKINKSKCSIDLSALSVGVYIIKYKSVKNLKSQKVYLTN